MTRVEIICRCCKNRCRMEVEYEGEETKSVSGNGCMRGMLYAQQKVAAGEAAE